MWIPKTEEEIVVMVTSGTLRETETFDAKRELPKNSKELAKDVAAMATEGGVLLYGVDEDDQGRPTILAPISLAGARERVDHIVSSGIAEAPYISVNPIETAVDRSKGYLVVVVPRSPRAPHMVILDKDHRYYGRSATGNIPLTEGYVAALYQRRQQWERDRDSLLAKLIENSPLAVNPKFAYLHLGAWPIASKENLLDSARRDQNVQTMLHELVQESAERNVFPAPGFAPDFIMPRQWIRRPSGWSSYLHEDPNTSPDRSPDRVLDLQINDDGSSYLFSGRAAQVMGQGFFVIEELVAGLTVRFVHLMGAIYARARYLGPVDLGVAVTNLRGAVSVMAQHNVVGYDFPPFDQPEYRRTARFSAEELALNPQLVAKQLVMPLSRRLHRTAKILSQEHECIEPALAPLA